jgi:hypothetical protein
MAGLRWSDEKLRHRLHAGWQGVDGLNELQGMPWAGLFLGARSAGAALDL